MARFWRFLGRVPRSVWVAAGVLVFVGALLTWRWMLSPSASATGSLGDADAVVMFVGGRGERLELASEIMESGAAEVLVIPNGQTPNWPQANALCAGSSEFEVVCPEPDPDTTRGEARVIADLAAERGWTSMIAVTSTYHLIRAELLLDRCFDGTITAVAASPDISPPSWIRSIVHEWFGHLHARVLARDC